MQKHFKTYSAINISNRNVPGLWVQIVELNPCCKKQQTTTRACFDNAVEMDRFSVDTCVVLNRSSVEDFLSFRPGILMDVWLLADKYEYILNRELFRESETTEKFPEVRKLKITEQRFIAICKILEKYGVFYRVYGENFVCFIKGIPWSGAVTVGNVND